MSLGRKSKIAGAFERAQAYDAHAMIQRVAADRLAARIAALDFDETAPALEIGCGTGFLTEALLAARPALRLTASDVAPAMLDRTRARVGDRAGIDYAVLDGEHPGPSPTGGWGLIASSLAAQWFEEPASSIARLAGLIAPRGCLAFTTLVSGSFAEWTAALEAAGLADVTRRYPEPENLVRQCNPDFHSDIAVYTLTERHENGMAFLRALRAIGAATSWDRTARPAALRRAIEHFEEEGASVRYEIAEIVIRRKHG